MPSKVTTSNMDTTNRQLQVTVFKISARTKRRRKDVKDNDSNEGG
jgi:hypothetical protein